MLREKADLMESNVADLKNKAITFIELFFSLLKQGTVVYGQLCAHIAQTMCLKASPTILE